MHRHSASARFFPLIALHLALALGLALLAAGVRADTAERREIARAKQDIEQRFKAAEAACREHFVVTPCVDEAKAKRREELAPWREREIRLDEAERRQRAAARLEDVSRKKAEAEAAAVRAAASAASAPASAARGPLLAPHASAAPPAPRAPMDGGAQEAAERAARAAQRQREAEAKRQRIEQRQRERAAKNLGQKGAPLPAQPAASR